MVGGYAAPKTVSLYLSTSDRQWHDDRRTKNQALNFDCIQDQMTFRLRLKPKQSLMEFQLPQAKL